MHVFSPSKLGSLLANISKPHFIKTQQTCFKDVLKSADPIL